MKKLLPLLVVGCFVLSGLGAVATNVVKETDNNIIETESLGDPLDYTHTVLVEAGMRTGCPACPATNAAWKSIYAGGQYDFEYVGLIYEYNSDAMQRFNSFNPAYVPTSYWDGGEKVYVGTNSNTFKSYLDACGSRTVPDLVGEVSAMWLGDAKIDISISVENNDNDDYPGTLRVYVVELVSRWNDYNGQPYGHALLDFPWQQSITIESGDTFEDSKVWDGGALGFGDIEPDNIQIILTMSDNEAHQAYSDPPSGNPFNAYYVDMTVAAFVDENQPPNPPAVDGPTSGEPEIEYEYTFTVTDPEEDGMYLWIDWGDGTTDGWLGEYDSGEDIIVAHTYDEAGIYEITAKARDINYNEGEYSEPYVVAIGNLPPETPTIQGPESGKIGTSYDYIFTSTDPNGDQIKYFVKWGDGNSEESDLFASGTAATLSHKWNEKGNWIIEAKAIDPDGAESGWGRLSVNMPRNRILHNGFLGVLQQLFNNYPLLQLFLGI